MVGRRPEDSAPAVARLLFRRASTGESHTGNTETVLPGDVGGEPVGERARACEKAAKSRPGVVMLFVVVLPAALAWLWCGYV